MKKKTVKLLALCMAMVISVGCFAGCKKSSTVSEISYWEEVPGVPDASGDVSGSSGTDNSGGGSSAGASGDKVSSGQQSTAGNVKVYKENGIEFLVDPKKYRGTTVTYCTWRDPEQNEDGTAIKAFEKKYGIKVEIQMIEEGKYVSTIASRIAAGTQGDVFFQQGNFPASLSVLQPLDLAKINFNDPIWKQETIEAGTIDGHKYIVNTVSNVWDETDIILYNKTLFEENGITTPTEYYEAGNWTFETFEKACRDICALGKSYCGAQVRGETMCSAAGTSIYTFANNKITMTADQRFYDVMQYLSRLKSEKLIGHGNNADFPNGKCGMEVVDLFALKRSGHFPTMNGDDLAATYLPRWDKNSPQVGSSTLRGWGLIKGAKNPEAAGIFLREYLDVNNYDLDETFHSKELADFFFQATSKKFDIVLFNNDQGVMYANGINDTAVIAGDVTAAWNHHSPDQIKAYLDSQMPVLKNYAATADKVVQDARKYLKDNFG